MHIKNIFAYLKFIRIQLLIIIIFFTFLFLGYVGVIPSPDKQLILLKDAFTHYGLLIILLASFIENLFGVNTYFPGAVVIFTGMSLSQGDIPKAIVTFLCIFIPVLIANSINFYIGRSLNSANPSSPLSKKKLLLELSTKLWHPYLASITSFSIGSKKLKYVSFISLFFPVSLIWNIFWGILAYKYGPLLTQDSNVFIILFIIYLLIWTLTDSIKFFKIRNYG